MVLSQDEKGLGSHSKSRKPSMREQSGTCNVCSAPCTSCLHINRVLMGSKTEEFFDDNCQGNDSSQYSVNDTVTLKSRACESGQHAASETSNLLIVNSNHDSSSENVESKTSLRTCDVPGTSEGIEMPSGVTAGGDQFPLKPEYNSDRRSLVDKDKDQKDLEDHDSNISSIRLTGGSATASKKNTCRLEVESETEKISVCLSAEAVNASEQIGETEKVKESCKLSDVPETSLHSQPVDDSDASDLVEQDVKVCDICGDAGREDLLAICNRCTDGAEHTYCMREMVDKVPEGDWLCEECKLDDENKSLKQDRSGTVDGNERNESSGLASTLSTDLFVKLDKKDSDVEGTKKSQDTLGAKASGKRPAENVEVGSAAKRLALDPAMGSPKTSSPSRLPALSRDFSFRNLDKGKVKPTYQSSSGTSSSNNASETASAPSCPRLQSPRGTLLKSNSFNYSTSKPKVKLVDEAVPQKKRLVREPSAVDMKDGAARLINKSMSFKSGNPSESKVKMLSPKLSHGQDLKGLKQVKEWNSLDRRNSFKSERSMVSSSSGNATVSVLKGEQKVASYGESQSLPSMSNSHEAKGVQADSKLTTLSKSASHVVRRGSETSGSLGGVKRQSCVAAAAGASLNNGAGSSAEQKPNQTNLMESTNSGEKVRGNSIGRARTSITTGGRSAPCQKCNEVGHSVDSCTVGNPRSLGDTSAARNLRDEANNGNKLKAAIEAAMLKKPGIYRKNKTLNQSEELPMSSTNINCGTRPQDQSTSVNTKNILPADEISEGPVLPGEICKQTAFNSTKQLSAPSSEGANVKTGDTGPINHSDGKPFTGSHTLVAMTALLKMSAIPEHEYIWQGCFEIQKSGERSELHDGIQGHLSTCASPKVLEVVNRFPSRIILNEVPRLSTWPVHFQKTGAKDDNIALYFFAKDLDSYEKSYKSLLDSMMRSNLALRGSFDGVELLIFPSNCLPEKSQRWNMLYFLWGVFRGKKVHCLQDGPDAPKKYNVPTALPTDILPLPGSSCSLGTVNEVLPTCPKTCNVALKSECPASGSMESPCSSPVIMNGDCHTELSRPEANVDHTEAYREGKEDCRLDTASLPRVQITRPQPSQGARCTSTPLEENVEHERKVDIEVQPPVRSADTIGNSMKIDKLQIYPSGAEFMGGTKKIDKMPVYPDDAHENKQISSSSSEMPLNSNAVPMTSGRTLKEEEGSVDTKTVLQSDIMMRDRAVNDMNNWQHDLKKRLHEDSTWTVSQVSASASETSSWNNVNGDDGPANKKHRTDYSELYFCGGSRNTSHSKESSTSGLHEYGSLIKDEVSEEACKEREVSKNNWAARFFFPVDPHAVEDLSKGDNPVAWKAKSAEDDRLHGGVPNLNLALGAEMKPAKHGIWPLGDLDLNDVQEEEPPDEAVVNEDDDVSACLSLSLSFPFPDKEPPARPVPKVEQLLPDGQRLNTSFLLFDGLSKK